MGAFVNEEAVEAGQHGQIGRNLQVAGIPGVRAAIHAVGGKRFTCNDILSIEMGYGG